MYLMSFVLSVLLWESDQATLVYVCGCVMLSYWGKFNLISILQFILTAVCNHHSLELKQEVFQILFITLVRMSLLMHKQQHIIYIVEGQGTKAVWGKWCIINIHTCTYCLELYSKYT